MTKLHLNVPLSESADCITRDRFPLKKFTWRKNKQEGRVCMYANLDRFVLWGGAAGNWPCLGCDVAVRTLYPRSGFYSSVISVS